MIFVEHLALYRKYRPRTFDDVYGQEHITSVLKYESMMGRLSHAYLFCGPRGTGKTTCAKILSKAVNCDSPVNGEPCGKCFKCTSIDDGSATDVVEMDAASNTGVDYIREIRDEVAYTPAYMKKRVYIIDEVHMLSIGAFNALLKTLEEPPEHVLFILATTEQHKLPATIISRCQRFDFRRIGVDKLVERLEYISEHENITLEHDAAIMLAKQAQGGMRDAINLLELCAGGGHDVTSERVGDILGITGAENAARVARAVKNGDLAALFTAVSDVVSSSKDISVFWQELISFWRDMLVALSIKDAAQYLDLTAPEAELLRECAAMFKPSELIYHSTLLDEALVSMSRLPQVKRNLAEMTLVRMTSPALSTSPEAMAARLTALEDKVKLLSVAPRVQRESVQSSDDDFKMPSPQETKSSEQVTTKKNDDHIKPAPAVKRDTWKRVTDKSELIEKISSLDPMLRGFASKGEFYVSPDRHRVILRVPDRFSEGVLARTESLETLSAALVITGSSEADVVIKVECADNISDEGQLIDEIEEL